MATYYWVSRGSYNPDYTTDWSASYNWSYESGGPPGYGPPGPYDTAVIDGNSFLDYSLPRVSILAGATCYDFIINGAPSFNLNLSGAFNIYGGLYFQAGGINKAGTGTVYFNGASSHSITTNGFTFNAIIFQHSGSYTINDSLVVKTDSLLRLTSGTLNLAGAYIQCGTFESYETNARTLTTGGSYIYVTNDNDTVANITYTNLTVNGPTYITLYGSAAGTRTLRLASGTEGNVFGIYVPYGSGPVTVASGSTVYNVVFDPSFTGSFAPAGGMTVYGYTRLSPSMSMGGSAGTYTVAATAITAEIISNGVSFNRDIAFSGSGGISLNGSLATTGNITHTAGTVAFNNYNITAGTFTSSGTGVRALAIGTGKITVTGNNATVFSVSDPTNLTVTGNRQVDATYSGGTGTRTFTMQQTSLGGSESNAFNLNIVAGSDIVAFSALRAVGSLNFTGFSGTANIGTNQTITLYGDLTIPASTTIGSNTGAITFSKGSGTQTISSAATIDKPLTFAGTATYTLARALTAGSTRTSTLTSGTLNLNGQTFSTGQLTYSGSTLRSIAFNDGKIVVTGNGATVVSATTQTNFTYTGTSRIELTYSGSTGTRTVSSGSTDCTEVNALNYYVTAGSDIVAFTTNHKTNTLDFTGFSGTLTATTRNVYGSLTLSPTMTVTAGGAFNLTGSFTSTVRSNGLSVDSPMTFNGVGSYTLYDALSLGSTRALTLTSGTLDANNKNVTAGSVSITGSNNRTISMGSGTWTLLGTGTVWNATTTTNLVFNQGTSTIRLADGSTTGKTFAGGGLTYRDVVLDGAGTATYTITGANTFNSFSNAKTVAATVAFPASTTTTFTGFDLDGTATGQLTIQSATSGTRTILSQASGTVNANYLTLKDTNATGGALWNAFTNTGSTNSHGNINNGNNLGWDFCVSEFLLVF